MTIPFLRLLICISTVLLPITLTSPTTTPPSLSSNEHLRGGFRYSYVYMTAENRRTGQRVTTCANYQQYKSKSTSPRLIAEDYESAEPFVLRFYNGSKYHRTEVCPVYLNPKQPDFTNNIVPLNYRILNDGSQCSKPFTTGQGSFRNATQFTVDMLKNHNAGAALLLLKKGHLFVQNWRDYRFANFYDPTLRDDSIPTFYIYQEDLFNEIMPNIGNNSEIDDGLIDVRFHRPADGLFDNSMIVIWLIAMTCVTGGGLWAHHRLLAGKDTPIVTQTKNEDDSSDSSKGKSCLDRWGNTISILIMMFGLCTVLLIGYYFRPFSVFFFNILLVVFGTISISDSIRALFSNFSFSQHRWYQAKMEWFPLLCGRTEKFTYTSTFYTLISFIFCITWYFNRLHAYAFIPLDIINMALCLHVLKCLRLPSLKWISILMICMFVYDAFMVFGTPHITSNGCSIMLEVATGITGCNDKELDDKMGPGYPVPPIDKQDETPEKFPMLIQIPHMNVMNDCLDMEVEVTYQTSILGLGDIVMPGYLIAHCFTMYGFKNSTRRLYGLISIIGYGFGLIATFLALVIYNVAQPALIYLVPFTLIPICLLAVCRGEFRKMWEGVPPEEQIVTHESFSHVNTEEDEDPLKKIENSSSSSSTTNFVNSPVNV